METTPVIKKHILIIEDDHFIGEMYKQALIFAGFEVEWVTDGENGLSAAKTGAFDLILLDIMLPGRMGNDILRELRSGPDPINTKIIVTTNFEQDKESRAAMEAQVDAYLIKADVTPRRLVEIIKDILSGAKQA